MRVTLRSQLDLRQNLGPGNSSKISTEYAKWDDRIKEHQSTTAKNKCTYERGSITAMEISCFAYRLRTAVLLLAFSYINIFDFEPQNLAAQHFSSFFHQTFHSATALPRCAGLDSNAESSVLVKEALCEFINLKRKKKKLTWMWRPQKRTVPKSTAKTKWFGPVKQLQSSWPGLFFPSGESAKLLCVISKDFNISCVTHWLKRVILLHIITLLTVDSTFLIDYW